MKIAQISNYKVGAIYNLPTVPPEFVGQMGTVYQDITEHPLVDSIESGWKYEGGEFLPPDPTIINYGTKITKLAFLNRLGDAVLGSIEAASRVNNPLGYAAAVIKIKHASSTYIDLSLPETAADVQKLVDYGFIDSTKKDEVLNTPVQEKEVPIFISNATI